MATVDFSDFLKEELQNASFKKAFQDEKHLLASALALVEAREEAGLSQRQLAQRAHLPQSTIARIESGQNTSIETMMKIASALGRELKISFV